MPPSLEPYKQSTTAGSRYDTREAQRQTRHSGKGSRGRCQTESSHRAAQNDKNINPRSLSPLNPKPLTLNGQLAEQRHTAYCEAACVGPAVLLNTRRSSTSGSPVAEAQLQQRDWRLKGREKLDTLDSIGHVWKRGTATRRVLLCLRNVGKRGASRSLNPSRASVSETPTEIPSPNWRPKETPRLRRRSQRRPRRSPCGRRRHEYEGSAKRGA